MSFLPEFPSKPFLSTSERGIVQQYAAVIQKLMDATVSYAPIVGQPGGRAFIVAGGNVVLALNLGPLATAQPGISQNITLANIRGLVVNKGIITGTF